MKRHIISKFLTVAVTSAVTITSIASPVMAGEIETDIAWETIAETEDEVIAEDVAVEDVAVCEVIKEEEAECEEEGEIAVVDADDVDTEDEAPEKLITDFDADSTDTVKNLTLTMFPQKSAKADASLYNYKLFKEALEMASEDYKLNIKLVKSPDGGASNVIELETPASGTLNIRSNTSIDLGGLTLLSKGDSLMNTNIFCNSDMNGFRTKDKGCKTGTKYNLSHDIELKNGTIDGNSKSVDSKANLITFGHAKNITVENVNFTHNAANHLLEFSGCKGVKVIGCTFDGYMYKHSKDDYEDGEFLAKEALELDISAKGKEWAGAYDGDNTVCEDVLVTNCKFLEFPCGVGDHHQIRDMHASNIEITNNEFTYNGKEKSGSAIRTFAFNNCKITGNTINGFYDTPIRVYGGTNTVVSNNKIVKADTDGILVAKSAITGTAGEKNKEMATKLTIENNTITANFRGIFVKDASVIEKINNNNLSAKKDSALSVNFSQVGEINDNVLSAPANEALIIRERGTVVGDVLRNTITSSNGKEMVGIRVASNAEVKNISDNTINSKEAPTFNGIRVTAKAKVTNINGNKIFAKNRGFYFDHEVNVSNVKNNEVRAGAEALSVGTKAVVKTVSGNNLVSTSTSTGAIVIKDKGSKVTTITKNTVVAPDKGTMVAFKVANGGYVKTISNNIIGTDAAKNSVGLRVTGNGSKVDNIDGNSIVSSWRGIFIDTNAAVKNVRSNTVTTTKGDTFFVSNGSIVTTVGGAKKYANTFTAKKTVAVVVMGKGATVDNLSYNKLTAKNKKNGYCMFVKNGAKIKTIKKNTYKFGKKKSNF